MFGRRSNIPSQPGRVFVNRIAWIGLVALLFAPLPSTAQSVTSTGVTTPNHHASGTYRARERHRHNLSRDQARATSEHARRVRQGQ
jgi:hypothetical protein